MRDAPQVFVLDSYALLAYYQAESGGAAVLALLEAARDQTAILHLSLINAGELYYILYRQRGAEAARQMLENLRELPVVLEHASEERILAAAQLKAEHRISYADAFAALALELSATLVTGDPEMKSVERIVPVNWLQPATPAASQAGGPHSYLPSSRSHDPSEAARGAPSSR